MRKKRHGHINETRPFLNGKAQREHFSFHTWKWLHHKENNAIFPERWQSFDLFNEDVGERPSPGHRLCLIDESQTHCKENVLWLTYKEERELRKEQKRKLELDNRRNGIVTKLVINNRKQKRCGLTKQEYERMVAAAGDVCEICRRPERLVRRGKVYRLSVDHDHKTGHIRGILCTMCNAAIGQMDDSIEILTSAIEYLSRHKTPQNLRGEGI
jgi:hypothetical protein